MNVNATPMVEHHAPLQGVEIAENKESIKFIFTDGTIFTYSTYGDCCSATWIEHVTIPPDIAGTKITGIKDDYPVESWSEGWEEIQKYQTAFQTPRGEIIVEYRNSSNGYYGGWLEGPARSNP